MQRNLIAHIYPRLCGKWRNTTEHLVRAWDQFDGRKIITVAVDECCDDAETVQAEFAGLDVEWIVRQNDRPLQEVASFLPMLERVIDEPGMTLYVHAKGATHVDDNAASHPWGAAMREACLDYHDLVDCFMERFGICGAFRSHGLWAFPRYHNWHYAGTHFWFRNSRAKELAWREVHPNFMGVEAWPGIFPLAESGCLFYENAHTADLYSPDFWRTNITPSLKWWRKSLANVGIISRFQSAPRQQSDASGRPSQSLLTPAGR